MGTNKKQRARNKKNAYLHCPQNQRKTSASSQGRGASTAILPPCCDLCQNVVPRRFHPRTLHDRAEDGEEGKLTACRQRRRRSSSPPSHRYPSLPWPMVQSRGGEEGVACWGPLHCQVRLSVVQHCTPH